MPQSRAAMAVARALAPASGERVLDLCAAPGGKTTHLAALMGDVGEIVAVEKHPGRAEALRKTAQRMGATIVDVRTQDATQRVEETLRPRARRPAVQRTSAHSPPGPTRAGARPAARRRWPRCSARSWRPERRL